MSRIERTISQVLLTPWDLNFGGGTTSRLVFDSDWRLSVSDIYNSNARHVSRAWSTQLDLGYRPRPPWKWTARLRHASVFAPQEELEERS